MDEQHWKIGDLAAASGLTVRTLHHFDRIGLLCPAHRSAAGHRLYTEDDVGRLYRILALRQLGIPLIQIAHFLDGDLNDLGTAVRAQLAQVETQAAAQHELRARLTALLRAIEEARDPSVDQLIATMEAMVATGRFTPEQWERARARHADPGFAATFDGWLREGGMIAEELAAHLERGTNPAEPAVQHLAQGWTTLINDMAAGDRTTVAAIYARIDRKGPEAATRGVLTSPVWEYLRRAFAAGFGT
jgi:DNA-binding transcriptional MerR regulator